MAEQKHRYFQFSRRERRGIYVLVIIIAACFIVPEGLKRITPRSPPASNTDVFNRLPETLPPDSFAAGNRRSSAFSYSAKERKPYKRNYEPGYESEPVLFYFNPNTISAEEWAQLGVHPRTIATILRYREKGGRFRTASDLEKIYGLPARDAERLAPFVRIEEQNETANARNNRFYSHQKEFAPSFTPKDPDMVLNINTADSTKWMRLPGIGAGYARRIIYFREKLGGFYSVNQVAETRGLPDSVFQKIKQQLVCPDYIIEKLDINTATQEILVQHPYISKNLAAGIVQYRNQHGPFSAIGDLRKIALVTEELFRKISPYLAVKNKT